VAAHFEWGSIGLNHNEDRSGRIVNSDGIVQRLDGTLVRITAIQHDLDIDSSGALRAGTIGLLLEDGQYLKVEAKATSAMVYMAGAGYDGRHGQVPQGSDPTTSTEIWNLADPGTIDGLAIRLVDRHCRFRCGSAGGSGIVETGLTRSREYTYRATLSADRP
jgi:hypothetical protein